MEIADYTANGIHFVLEKHNTSYTMLWDSGGHTFNAKDDHEAIDTFHRLAEHISK